MNPWEVGVLVAVAWVVLGVPVAMLVGRASHKPDECVDCHGVGEVHAQTRDGQLLYEPEGRIPLTVTCRRCDGDGYEPGEVEL